MTPRTHDPKMFHVVETAGGNKRLIAVPDNGEGEHSTGWSAPVVWNGNFWQPIEFNVINK